MFAPQSGSNLQQFVCAMQWMRARILEFLVIIRPLTGSLESAYTVVGKRTWLAVCRVAKIGWSFVHANMFQQF